MNTDAGVLLAGILENGERLSVRSPCPSLRRLNDLTSLVFLSVKLAPGCRGDQVT